MCGNEDSFTKLNNKLFDALQRFHCGELKKEILLNLIRLTFGYHRESTLTSAAAIASYICRNKAKTRQALKELIECNIVIADSKGGPGRTRRLSINMDILKWRHKALPEEDETSQTSCIKTEEIPPILSTCKQSPLGASECSQIDSGYSDLGAIKESPQGAFKRSQMEQPPKSVYIDGKSSNFSPKENIKEKERNIYMYDITLIPKTLSEMPGFKRAFNDWYIYRQEMEKPLTGIIIDVQMRKLLLYNSEGYNVVSIIENSISAGWPDLYRPGSRQESPVKQVEYKSARAIKNESY